MPLLASLLQIGARAGEAFLAKIDKQLAGLAQHRPTANKHPAQVQFERAYQALDTSAWRGNFVGRIEQQETLTEFLTDAVEGECDAACNTAMSATMQQCMQEDNRLL